MRGNQAKAGANTVTEGSIPARAGEPVTSILLNTLVKVYPRACGGTAHPDLIVAPGLGLSPRVRGNQHHTQHRLRRDGSIPARAGEPYRPEVL